MYTQSELEDAIRRRLPILFGKSDSVAYTDLQPRFEALIDFLTRISEPVLRAETIRYQSILLYWSLILLTLASFEIGNFKIGEAIIKIDKRLFVLYSVFLAAVAVIFLIKSYVDYQRASFVRYKDANADEAGNLLTVGRLKYEIQVRCWDKIWITITRAYTRATLGTGAAMPATPDQPTNSQLSDEESFRIKVLQLKEPELEAEINFYTDTLTFIETALARDEDRLRSMLDALPTDPTDKDDPLRISIAFLVPDEKVQSALDQCLRPWLNARDNLSRELREQSGPKNKICELGRQAKTVRSVLKNAVRIRRVYVLLEIVAPVAFAALSIIYVWKRTQPAMGFRTDWTRWLFISNS